MLFLVATENERTILQNLLPGVELATSWQAGSWKFVLRWGVAGRAKEDSGAIQVLNRSEALASFSLEKAQAHWAASRIRFTKSIKGRFYKRYRVHLFDTNPYLMQRREIGQRGVRVVRWSFSSETRQVADLAIKALYAAGLDVGSVDLGMTSQGHLYVLTVNPAPKVTVRTAPYIARALKAWLRNMESRWTSNWLESLRTGSKGAACPRFLLGADPEFVLRNAYNGHMVFASDYFPIEGTVGCDSRRVRVRKLGNPLAEIRPRPAVNPLEVFDNINRALARASRMVPARHIQWRAGTLPFRSLPTGGHIHFGMSPSNHLMRALDNYLAVPFLMLENPGAARIRRRTYGLLGDFRLKRHGGFEYRVMPSWLVSPVYARAALCLAKVIGCEWPRLRLDIFTDAAARRAFRSANQEYFKRHMTAVALDLRSLPNYQQYAAEIEPLLELVLEGKRWRTSNDLRVAWQLRRARRRPRRR